VVVVADHDVLKAKMPRHGEDVAGLIRSARAWAITEETRSNLDNAVEYATSMPDGRCLGALYSV